MSERSETNVGLTDMLDGWRRIADELPPLDMPVWLCEPSGRRVRLWIGERSDDPDGWLWTDCMGSAYFDGDKWSATDAEAEDYHPTHWRQLPRPPNARNQRRRPA